MKKVIIVGLGLMGGSIALEVRRIWPKAKILGVDTNCDNENKAIELGLIDVRLDLKSALINSDLVVLAIPVDAIAEMLPKVLNLIDEKCVVIDLGSTKSTICASIQSHPKRGCFVAMHPIAGTENSGPEAAHLDLFRDKLCIVSETDKSNENALRVSIELMEKLGMRLKYLGAEEHDKHMAYVSHLSHISSFALGRTVLKIEKDEEYIFDLAGSGFESTVRLAKSSPEMWMPIFLQNKKYVEKALNEYIIQLIHFRNQLGFKSEEKLSTFMREANDIRRVLNKKNGSESSKKTVNSDQDNIREDKIKLNES